eukprot:6781279-Prymnesium_polylepis.1
MFIRPKIRLHRRRFTATQRPQRFFAKVLVLLYDVVGVFLINDFVSHREGARRQLSAFITSISLAPDPGGPARTALIRTTSGSSSRVIEYATDGQS